MFRINDAGDIVRDDVRAGSHEAHIVAGNPLPPDFDSLTGQARVSALLMNDFMAASIAPATARSYSAQWNKFQSWCSANNRVCLPASPDTVTLYLTNLGVRYRTLPPILAARSGIRYYLGIHFPDLPPPTESLVVATLVSGIKRKFARYITKKKPVTPDLVRKCLEHLCQKGLDYMNLVELRNAAMFAVLYFTAARFEEVADLQTENVMVSLGGNIELLYVKSKTNQYKKAHSAFLTEHSEAGNLDPVKIIIRYRNSLISAGGSTYFFPSMTGMVVW